MKPRLLDLFCGAGGAAMGYHWAGFEVVGVDIKPQPRYPFLFVQDDALAFLATVIDEPAGWWGNGFDAIHASPPCQAFTFAKVIQGNDHPDLLTPTRELLNQTGLPWVIENVPGAPMRRDLILCGTQFGLEADGFEVRRHRWFEFGDPEKMVPLVPPCWHRLPPIYGSGHSQDNPHKAKYGFCGAATCKAAMGVEWMNRNEQAQAIPPAYTELIGHQLMAHIKQGAAA